TTNTGTTADSDFRPLGIRRRSTTELESFIALPGHLRRTTIATATELTSGRATSNRPSSKASFRQIKHTTTPGAEHRRSNYAINTFGTTSALLRPSIYCFRDFESPDFVSAFTAFHGLRPSIYCFRDFESPDFVSAFTAFHGLRPSIYCFRDFGSPDFVSAFIAFRISRPLYCFLRALAPHLPLHILQISIRPHRVNGLRSGTTTQQSPTGHKGHRNECQDAQRAIGDRGTLNFAPIVQTGQNQLSRRRVARTFIHTTRGDIRLIQILVNQAFQIYKLIGHRRSDASSIKSRAFSGFSPNRMGPTAQPSQAIKPQLNPKPRLNPPRLGWPAMSHGSIHGRRLQGFPTTQFKFPSHPSLPTIHPSHPSLSFAFPTLNKTQTP
ncbi:hypothetical protein CRG98_014959, partial [Punica granatum]